MGRGSDHYSTTCVHHGEKKGDFLDSIVPPVFETVNFYFHTLEEAEDYFAGRGPERYYYTRGLNPTVQVLEKKIAALEKAPACKCFGSGMAAIAAAVLGKAQAGDHIVSVSGIYKNAYRLLTEVAPRFGIEVTFVSGQSPDDFLEALRPNTRIIYLESPTSSTLALQDLGAVAELAKSHGITTIIDNTLATPYNQNPRDFGIDIVVHAATKYLNGHGDVLMGAVCGDEETIAGLLRREHALIGGIPGPFEAWLVLRGLRTFPLRMQHFNRAGLEVAKFLEQHPRVSRVYYPFLPSHPQHDLASRQMRGASAIIVMELKGGPQAVSQFMDHLELFRIAASWGSFESLVWYPLSGLSAAKDPEWLRFRQLNPSMVRLSLGLEDIDDLMADLDQALARAGM